MTNQKMDIHYSYACEPCIARFIGDAVHRVLEVVPVATRDKCSGCGVVNSDATPVHRFSYWYPWPDAAEEEVTS